MKIVFLSFVLCLLAGQLHAAGLEEKVVEHRLANGMKLLMVERHTSPTVAAWIRFKVGSVDERSDERGLAHLLEHMLFKGTKTVGTTDYEAEKPILEQIEQIAQVLISEQAKREQSDSAKLEQLNKQLTSLEASASKYVIKDEFFDIYAKNGAVGYNAFTSRDGTTYLISLPSNKLELWAAIESDRMQNAVLREFYSERAVVMEERRRSVEAEAEGKLWETFIAASFMAHPYGQPTIGWMSEIENLTRTKAERFFHEYYGPQSAIVAIVGDIDVNSTIALVERYFADIKPGKQPLPVTSYEPPQAGERRIELVAEAEPTMMIGFHKPAINTPDDYVFDIISMILGHGRTSRFYRNLVVDKQIATEVTVFDAPGHRFPNLFIINADPRTPHSVKEVEDAILTELERLKSEPVTEQELKRVLNKIEFDEAQQMGTNSGLARTLTDYEALTGSWRYMIGYRNKVAAVTPADIQRVAKQYFTRENRTIGFLTKKESEAK